MKRYLKTLRSEEAISKILENTKPIDDEEYLPVYLDEDTNQYILEMFILTNNNVSGLKGERIYSHDNLNLFFF